MKYGFIWLNVFRLVCLMISNKVLSEKYTRHTRDSCFCEGNAKREKSRSRLKSAKNEKSSKLIYLFKTTYKDVNRLSS